MFRLPLEQHNVIAEIYPSLFAVPSQAATGEIGDELQVRVTAEAYRGASRFEQAVLDADLVIGAVLIPGASAPKLVSRDMVANMREGAVLVDVAIDQGGCFETSRPTTHADPTYIVDGVVHYCVANMPGAVARTSAAALNNATLPFVLELADKGVRTALNDNVHLLHGLNVCRGKIANESVIDMTAEFKTHGLEKNFYSNYRR